jgi:hypothetical protein
MRLSGMQCASISNAVFVEVSSVISWRQLVFQTELLIIYTVLTQTCTRKTDHTIVQWLAVLALRAEKASNAKMK